MFSLSQTTGHAIQALTCLAGDSCPHRFIQDIAESSGVPRAYLAKILKRLNEAGLVESKRGYKGGVWLARSAEEITLLDICLAIEGDDSVSCCLLGSDFCDDKRDCPTHKFWKKTRASIEDELDQTTLADVVAFEKKRRPSKRPTKRRKAVSP